jgi:hypothetical protein
MVLLDDAFPTIVAAVREARHFRQHPPFRSLFALL